MASGVAKSGDQVNFGAIVYTRLVPNVGASRRSRPRQLDLWSDTREIEHSAIHLTRPPPVLQNTAPLRGILPRVCNRDVEVGFADRGELEKLIAQLFG